MGSTIAGLLLGLLKFALTLGGIALAVVGLFTGNWALVVYGVISVIGGQVVHALDRRHHDKQLAEIAARAVAGIGPIPPPDVRRVLMRHALSQVGVGGNAERAFADLCQQWAAERRIGREVKAFLGLIQIALGIGGIVALFNGQWLAMIGAWAVASSR